MTLLIIDTSTDHGFVALSEGENVVKIISLPVGRNLSKDLLPAIQTLSKPEAIAYGHGPGSFTGTRVGATVAKTLGYGWNIPVVSFCSLLAFTPQESGPFVIRQKNWTLTGEKNEKNILHYSLAASEPQVADPVAVNVLPLPAVIANATAEVDLLY